METSEPDARVAEAADAGAGDRVFEGADTRVVVRADHGVEIHSTDLWGGAYEQGFESCAFASAAVPTLRRSLAPEKVDVVVQACGAPHPGAQLPHLPGAARGGGRPAARPAPAPVAH